MVNIILLNYSILTGKPAWGIKLENKKYSILWNNSNQDEESG